MNLFSITIPAYKASYLKEAIESVLAQTYSNFELIIVNDHSPEDLDSIVSQFNDSRIRFYVNEKNCGAENVVDNWNICLNYAKGDYIICMGDDDKLLPCCLDEYNKLIQQYPGLGVYHGWTEIIDEESKVSGMQEPRPNFEGVYSAIWGRWNGRMQYIGDYLYNTELLRQNGGFYKLPFAWGSDDMSAFIAASHAGIANTQVPVFQYRVNAQTISKTGNSFKKIEALKSYKKEIESIFSKQKHQNIEKTEYIFFKMCLKETNHYFDNKLVIEMQLSMEQKGLIKGIALWLKNRKMLHISFPLIMYSALMSIKSSYYRKRSI